MQHLARVCEKHKIIAAWMHGRIAKLTLAMFADRIDLAGWIKTKDVALSPARIKIEVLAGLTVALALVPEAVAFAFVASVHPLVGLYAAFIVRLITAMMRGRP